MLLALAIADHADDDGTSIYPSISMLATKTRQSERTVQYQLRRMEQAGWLILVNAGNGGRSQRREYRINPDWIKGAEIAPIEKGANDSTKGARNAPFQAQEKGAIDGEKGAIHDIKGANDSTKGCNGLHPHITVIEPSEEPSRTTNKKTRAKSPTADPAELAAMPLPHWLPRQAWADWVEHRVAVKAPMTQRAAELAIAHLGQLMADGSDPAKVIARSVRSGKWTDLYELPENQRTRKQPVQQRLGAAPTNAASINAEARQLLRSRASQGVIDV
jgi:hypothetical protein